MAFFRSVSYPATETVLTGEHVVLRAPSQQDFAAWSSLREESRGFLKPWEPQWPADDLSKASYRRRLRRYSREMREDRSYPFFVFRRSDGELLGGATLSNLRRGVAQCATLGYWMGEPYAGKGYMSEAVRLILPFAFVRLRLHRVEAACLPRNAASITLLEKVGFRREGYARRYLCIDGQWEDHILYARLADDPEPQIVMAGARSLFEPDTGLPEKETL
ncbi:GNAT family N-acetyltransferase [Stappia sp. GBMRC 2046]|uniref:GNAT family N-acetyltransferase n=1 Tax=Stappia sediminis TaxID=2692190 RepID=A0A7X3S8T6_9HYPH|nr:GNAT family protein [Stappia sediminis]MXN66105.1 GNAT family N-acetyltransferase [Stappia sediminis]